MTILRNPLAVIAFAMAAAPALAQYNGTFTTKNAQGGTVTLTLKQQDERVSGTLVGNGNTFEVKGEVNDNGLVGTVTSDQASLFIAAELKGRALTVILAEPGADGRPNMQAARQIAFTRSTGRQDKAPAAAAEDAAPQAEGGGQDDKIRQFLSGNAWCGFTYNKTSGTSRTERVVFRPDGVVTQGDNTETYSSGYGGTVAGQHRGGQQGRWRVQDGQLHLSADGMNWAPQQLQVTRNSNGSPIIKSGGKEYMVCR